jgi:hypothetical protein
MHCGEHSLTSELVSECGPLWEADGLATFIAQAGCLVNVPCITLASTRAKFTRIRVVRVS